MAPSGNAQIGRRSEGRERIALGSPLPLIEGRFEMKPSVHAALLCASLLLLPSAHAQAPARAEFDVRSMGDMSDFDPANPVARTCLVASRRICKSTNGYLRQRQIE